MIPRLTIGLVVVVIVAYIVGAKYPQLAQKVGIA
jgi:hypothetical protein